MGLYENYRRLVTDGTLKADALQDKAARALQSLADVLKSYRPRRWLIRSKPPKGVYLWGDVGRGKSMLMDLFFEAAPTAAKRRIHFNAFMEEAHERIHKWRNNGNQKKNDPIPPVARELTSGIIVLCFDEFQVNDVADAMILGRLFEQLFARGVVIVATSNTAPHNLYLGGLNRQLFLPFIALLEKKLDVIELNGRVDYRLAHMAGLDLYITPLGPEAEAKMEAAWQKLSGGSEASLSLKVYGRTLNVPRAAHGVARFSFAELCGQPLAAADYLAVARTFHTVLIDNIPAMKPEERNEALRFVLLIDTLYDEGVKLICSAAAAPDKLYPAGDGAQTFRRAASRLVEMQSRDYMQRAHGKTVPVANDVQ